MIHQPKYQKLFFISLLLLVAQIAFCQSSKKGALPKIKVSKNQHYFVTEDVKPFFWLGDTGWLGFGKLDKAGIDKYFADRKAKGFNVVQIMVLHNINAVNVYGDAALVNEDVSKPLTTPGNNFNNQAEYDYWDHVDYTLEVAQKNGIYLAMVPVWGTNVSKGNKISKEQAEKYAKFLADRYKGKTNVIWLNGGDTHGNEFMDIWNAIGSTLKTNNPDQLVTFHPFGRTDSSENYHNASWLDFNMFQSGHRRYDQDTLPNSFKEDNYKFVQRDFELKPTKPTLDGEPSYEGIPHGLHDTLQPKWRDSDVRRYAYWSVFAGGAGYTYGHNAVMQMFRKGDKPAYGNKELWTSAINAPGAGQMIYIKKLMERYNSLDRIPDQSLISNQGDKYDYLAGTRGINFALIYTFNGRKISVNMGKILGDNIHASWYNPRSGERKQIGLFENKGTKDFQPTGKKEDGNDWVLILESEE